MLLEARLLVMGLHAADTSGSRAKSCALPALLCRACYEVALYPQPHSTTHARTRARARAHTHTHTHTHTHIHMHTP